MTSKVLILYYSRGGKTASLAREIRFGVAEVPGVSVVMRTVASLAENGNSVPENGPPYVTKSDLIECDALALGSPTRFGTIASPLKAFFESTTDIWISGKLIGKPATVFTSSTTLHGGQESTLLSMLVPLLHHGMLAMGIPYSEQALSETKTGGTPYGASHVAGSKNEYELSEHECLIARTQGRRLAEVVQKLAI
jgi:NAD(P)H dehydrogenase (quinone)